MTTAGDDVSELLRESAVNFLGSRRAPGLRAADLTAAPEFDGSSWRELAELGWLGLGLPPQMGGPGLGVREAAVLCEQLGFFATPAPYVAASVLPAAVLKRCDNPGDLGAQLVRGECPFAFAWRELPAQGVGICAAIDGGSRVRTRYAQGRVSGIKRFVVAAESQGILLVNADHDGIAALVAVAADSPGVRLERYAAGLGSEATVYLDEAPVISGRPLATGEAARQALSGTLREGRIAIAAQLAGLAQGVLEKTLRYVAGRVQFGKPIASFQAIRHRCVDLYIATRLASASWNHALQCLEREPAAPSTEAAVSAAKARCGDVAVQAAREAVQMHGAMGFTEEGGVGAFLRAALHGRAWLGTPLAHRRRFTALTLSGGERIDG